ncbi:MAG: helix-turn-helix domain-containing protein [Candidatus Aenigmarchaeota archaeon]|nr:helix-turn-helix domain-containing protein [Candidatus Aenigmarchaeota archaeon]
MPSPALDSLNHKLKKLNTNERQHFLRGVYKELAVSRRGRQANGLYRRAYEKMDELDRSEFVAHVADGLDKRHADRLLSQTRMPDVYDRRKATLASLDQTDRQWRNYAKLYVFPDGIKLNVNRYPENPFSASIILTERSYGNADMLYEMLPVFNGKRLSDILGKSHVAAPEAAQYVTVKEAAEILGKSVVSIYPLIHNGTLKDVRTQKSESRGRPSYLINRNELEMLKGTPTSAAPKHYDKVICRLSMKEAMSIAHAILDKDSEEFEKRAMHFYERQFSRL